MIHYCIGTSLLQLRLLIRLCSVKTEEKKKRPKKSKAWGCMRDAGFWLMADEHGSAQPSTPLTDSTTTTTQAPQKKPEWLPWQREWQSSRIHIVCSLKHYSWERAREAESEKVRELSILIKEYENPGHSIAIYNGEPWKWGQNRTRVLFISLPLQDTMWSFRSDSTRTWSATSAKEAKFSTIS